MNQSIGVIAEVETADALTELEAIAAVDGIDAIFIGPADLSASMGHVGQFMHPAVTGVMAQAVQRVKRIGKPIGTVGPTPESVAQYRAIGFDFVAIGSDIGLLMRAAHAASRRCARATRCTSTRSPRAPRRWRAHERRCCRRAAAEAAAKSSSCAPARCGWRCAPTWAAPSPACGITASR